MAVAMVRVNKASAGLRPQPQGHNVKSEVRNSRADVDSATTTGSRPGQAGSRPGQARTKPVEQVQQKQTKKSMDELLTCKVGGLELWSVYCMLNNWLND